MPQLKAGRYERGRRSTASAGKPRIQECCEAHKRGDKAPAAPRADVSSPRAAKPATAGAKRPTRGDEVMELLRREYGATVEEMVARFSIKPHNVRAITSVEVRKRNLKVGMPGRAHYRVVG